MQLSRLVDEPRATLGFLGGYFLLQLLLRLGLGGGFELDEGEQLVLAQRLQAGYGAQPPLYTWLQRGFFQVFGHNLFALSLLKNLLLFGTYIGVYLAARRVAPTTAHAALAALSLLLLPQIAWESQRDLTHSVLVTCVSALSLWLALSIAEGRDQPVRYLLLGLLCGLGTLSKLNYLIFFSALLLALASLDRRLVLRPRLLLTLFAALLVASPYLLWVARTLPVALDSAGKFRAGGFGDWARAARGIVSLGQAVLAFCGPFVLIYLVIFRSWPNAEPSDESRRRLRRLLIRTLFLTCVILVTLLLLIGAEKFKDRWLQPLLFYLPLIFFASWPSHPLPVRPLKKYLVILLVVMTLVPVGLAGRVAMGPLGGKYTKPHFPGPALAQALRGQSRGVGLVLAENSLIAGNLKAWMPGVFISFPPLEFPLERIGKDRDLLLVWDADGQADPPRPLQNYLQRHFGADVVPAGETRILQAPFRYSTEETVRIGVLRLHPAPGPRAGAHAPPPQVKPLH